ncbi:MAG: hypothetical protein MJ234_02775 [bacterium]|nr:hypothetical protein [bacterium]
MMIKETNSESFESAIDILHHVSYEDPVLLRSISDLVQPVNYEKALEIAAGLTKRRNTWATSVLVDAASNDFEAIRHKAAFLLGECGPYMNADAKAQAVSSIVEKMDDCYDEDAQTCYLQAAKKIDQAITAERLILSCMTSGLAERKEKGRRLLEFLAAMKSKDMTKVFAKISNLQALYRFLSSSPSHKDSFTSEFANTFINLYRVKFAEVYGDEMWSNLLSESENKFSEFINKIWNIQF